MSAFKTFSPIDFKNSTKKNARHISDYYNQEKLIKTELSNFNFVCNPVTITKLKLMGTPKKV